MEQQDHFRELDRDGQGRSPGRQRHVAEDRQLRRSIIRDGREIADRPRVEEGRVVVRKTLPLCLSFDHRVVDGAEAARFMNDLKKILEQETLLTEAVKAAED
ncbi:MAG TPA: 2-oxo acid dehydrogenase subunit E2 [Acidobacteriota bacterium]